uniref:Uncharacterized protein n=1 Tax=Globisporangium ultimum (strain ATCC 200006 / CBS 805.95 / DAOM BR144) TaxID=431595 RepID=K3X817_GLOUD
MFSSWDLVRPSLWHPMSMLEQSMMDLDMMANQMLGSRFPMTTSMLAPPSMREDDDFFKDLPVEQREQKPAEKQPEQQREGNRAFSSYSFSSSSVVDDKGRRISSTRRRYEDSNGRLKAVHEREVDRKCLKTIWNRKNRDDQGEHKILCSQGTPDEFEKVWSETPFGQAQEKKNKELEKGETESQNQQHQAQGTEGKSQIQEQQPMSKSST